MLETTQHERHIITYDDCQLPAVAALRHSVVERDDADRYKRIVRLLKAWRVSTKPARKRQRPPLRKHRAIPFRYLRIPTAHGEIIYRVCVAKGSKRPHLEDLRTTFDRLSALKKINDVADEYTFRPTERAYISTKLMIMRTYQRMGERFPKPRIVPDGEAGIVATWRQNGRSVRLRFQEKEDYEDYIYYQSDGEYDVEAASVENLTKRLEWLNST
jgi:hypothetical protein